MTTNLRRRTAIAVAGLAAALGLGLLLLSPADAYLHDDSITGRIVAPIKYYGAIAYGPNGVNGKSWNNRTRAQAESSALKLCGVESCKVISSFIRCGAVAFDGSNRHGGVGRTRQMAEDDAMFRLGGGWIETWACNT
ncbi:hypothetical protein VIMS_00518 [Mycobacterium marinum]|uniref:DUF4189 domain-containing protein n=1 Tax=Mycobacterium marinum TaxID=1781 RepID=UPI000E3BFED6|nr:DUF4189 domain-containing protein [Mycobacterium marinum]RFZ21400.1 hypothetical protein VIMS_00518 [Mycobacterium marinum]